MKLDYKIIWVEDKIDTKPFLDLKKIVKNHLENEFFNVSIEIAEDLDEFKKKYRTNKPFDLIITDLNLNESHGNEVINFVRGKKQILTEVFFYSANSQLKSTQLDNSSRITFHQMDDGNAYKELGKSIIELIDLTISMFQNIVAMRGMIMHETSSLDVEMESILKKILKNSETSKDIVAEIKRKYKKSREDFSKNFDKVDDIESILRMIGASHRCRAIIRHLENGEIKKIMDAYQKEVIDMRNDFAHAKLITDNEGKKHFNKKDKNVIFDEKYCKKIRKKISIHLKNISNLDKNLDKNLK